MKRLFYCLMLPIVALALAACGDDEEPGGQEGTDPNKIVPDPEGTITLSMRYDRETSLEGAIEIDNSYNFVGDNYDLCYFVSLGKVKGLGNVTRIPTSGWAPKVAVEPGCGYVACHKYIGGIGNDDWTFCRIYVDDVMSGVDGSVLGYIVKYQTPFMGPDEELQLETNAVVFDENGGAATVKIMNTNFVPFTVESSEEWAVATPASTTDYSFINDAVYIEVYNGLGDPMSTQATVTLTTLNGKTSEITVTRTPDPFVALSYSSFGEVSLDAGGVNAFRIGMYGNVPLRELEATTYSDWLTVELQNSTQKSSPYKLKYIGGKPASEKAETSDGGSSLYYYDLVLSAPANMERYMRTASVYITSDRYPSFSQQITTVSQEAFYFNLGETSVAFPQEGGESSVRVWTSAEFGNFSVKSSEEWCTAELSYSEDDATTWLNLAAAANHSEEERTATVEVLDIAGTTVGTVEVAQKGRGVELSADVMFFDRTSSSQTIDISATGDFNQNSIICSDDWFTATLTGDGGLTVRVTDASENRKGVVSFAGFSKTLEIRQSKYALKDAYSENGVEGTVYYLENGQGRIFKDLGSTAAWSIETVFLGAINEDDGRENMEIVKKQPDWMNLYPAFAVADALNTNGITGWYLPAENEMPSNDYVREIDYWTSTESSSGGAIVYDWGYTSYSTGGIPKSSKRYIMAVYRFEY